MALNIFVLDWNTQEAVKCHVDKHCVKMITEHNQLLSTTHHMTNSKFNPEDCKAYLNMTPILRFAHGMVPYKKAYYNHPCAKWARESLDNYLWLARFTLHLSQEYTHRYGKVHAGEPYAQWFLDHLPPIENTGLTPFALAMPDEYKCNDPVQSYRNYYNGAKRHLFKWTKREVPEWIEV